MKAFRISDIVNPQKFVSHVFFAAVALISVVIVFVKDSSPFSFLYAFSFFLLGFMQLEIFILIASRVFREIPTGLSWKEQTRYLLVRLLLFLIACFIVAIVLYIVYMLIISAIKGEESTNVVRDFMTNEFSGWFDPTIKGLAFGAVIFVFLQWQEALKREQKLKEENLTFQNETLRNQVNPHFLFNSLNTLSSLIATSPAVAERFTVKLASIYRYILENSQKRSVTLAHEIDFISDYFELHRIRDAEKIRLETDIPPEQDFSIIPVSLQILVENAIKHNSATRENPLVIRISIENDYVVVRNNLQPMTTGQSSTGIGLKNLSQRSKLTTGRDVVIEETSTEFIVKIPLL